jgi:hypothetical protein
VRGIPSNKEKSEERNSLRKRKKPPSFEETAKSYQIFEKIEES